VSPTVISYELRRQHGFTEAQTAVLIHEASLLVPRRDPKREQRDRSHRDDRGRLGRLTGG